MKNKSMSIPLVVLILLTVFGSTLILSFPPVFANPACGSKIAATTTLTGNIGPCSGAGLIIGANSITLNCAGHTISAKSGNTNDGITLSDVTGVTVKNCKVTGFDSGFYLYSTSYNTLTGNTANSNGAGFYLFGSYSGDTLSGNTANSNTSYGFYLYGCLSVTLSGNTANSNGQDGFLLSGSTGITLAGNTANSNGIGFILVDSNANTLTKNTANKNTVFGYDDGSTSSSAGVPHWDTENSYGTTKAALSTTGDKGTGNVDGLAYGNANLETAKSPF